MKKALFLSCLILGLTFTSCEEEPLEIGSTPQNENPTENDFSEYFGNEITRTFLGRVIDEGHGPIENATVKIGNSTAMTDENGVFLIADAKIHENFGYVKATKPGYLDGSRSVVPTDGTNKVTIMLLAETTTGTASSGETKTISLQNGASVKLQGEYVDENGKAYSGSVDVILHHLDPGDEDMRLQMPGMLYASNSENEERGLISYGMLAVELRGSNGQELNLAEGATAEISMPLSPELLASAPSTIPLWHFDEEKGYWIEEGEAVLQGNVYVGEVSHFSFWNCDDPFPSVNLCVTVLDHNGNPLPNVRVDLSYTNYPYNSSSGFTNGNSMVCGSIPSGELLNMEVVNPGPCQEVLYSSTIGPYNADANLNVVVSIPPSTLINESIVGNFNDCNGNPVVDGYVKLIYEGVPYIDVVINGTFNFDILHCVPGNSSFTIEGVDYTNKQTTGIINYTFTSPNTNLGTLVSCNTTNEFVQYSIDNGTGGSHYGDFDILTTFELLNPNYNAPTISISHYSNQAQTCFSLFGVLNASPYLGSYDELSSNTNDTGFQTGDCPYVPNTNIVFNLTALGNVGQYIDINYSGTYTDFQGNPHTVTGVVHVIRDN